MNKVIPVVYFGLFITAILACSVQESRNNPGPNNTSGEVLVFSKTEGYRHSSIPEGIATFKHFGEDHANISIDTTENADQFTTDNLEKYGAVVFLNTTGDVLNDSQQEALKQFIQNGGGFMGVHAATDTEYEWPWYGKMIGARFSGHPAIQEATMYVLTKNHLSTEYLPGEWIRTDEWYNFSDIQDHINLLVSLDESTYEGGENGKGHPIAWYHEFEGGRVFYTGGGHTPESYSEDLFVRHLLGGLKYVLQLEN